VPAAAQTDREIETYREAERALAENPARAFELVQGLTPFERADDLRVELMAKAALRAGFPRQARQSLQQLREVAETESVRFWAGLTLAELKLLGSQVDAAADQIEDLRDDTHELADLRPAEERFFRSRLVRLRHDLALARDDRDEAREHALELATDFPTTDAAEMSGLVDVPPLDASQRAIRAESLYHAWAYERAREVFRTLLDHDVYGSKARWRLGQIALEKLRDRPAKAEQHFDALTDHPSYGPEALYHKARTYMVREDYERTLELLDDYEKRYPGGRRIESVYYYRGWLPYDHHKNEKAIEGFDQYIDRYGKRAGRSSYIYGFRAWAYMRLEEWKKAIEAYGEMESFGNMLVWGKALYWQAYAYRQLGKTEKALAKLDKLRETYPVTYYGVLGEQLRARIHGEDPRASQVWWPDGGGEADDSLRIDVRQMSYDRLDDEERATWARIQVLVDLGERERARELVDPLYDEMRASVPPDKRDAWVHAMGHMTGDYNRMWVRSTGGSISAMPEPPEPSSLEAVMAYPRAYQEIVDDVTGEFEIPGYLMWSIMRQESRYRPAQVSHADAVGALQMIPQTARKVADDLGTTYNPRTFYKPEVGFRFSGFYMRKLLDTFDGLIVPMATGYNTGPQVVAGWFRDHPEVGFPWLVEEFEYNEGRNYGRKVAEHFVRYLYLYEDDDERREELLDRLFPTDRDVDFPAEIGY
jgi:tetratricopeptide (TPR) repeat protein